MIIWFGSVFENKMVLENFAISPAANKWQLNFINQLNNSGYRVINVGHKPERTFPFGKLYVSKKEIITPYPVQLITVSYLNLPYLRILLINFLITLKIIKLLSNNTINPLCIISYNTYSYNLLPVLYSRFIKKIKWITLIADPMFEKSENINPFNLLADVKVFLSYRLFTASRTRNKFHFDGLVKKQVRLDENIFRMKEKIILYTGAISRYAGIELLLQAFLLTKSPDIRLIICGKGSNDFLNKCLSTDSRISFLGLIDEHELEVLYLKAYIFINPRLISEPSNNSNFPSKLLEYLCYSKPIISTYTGGVEPSYKQIIQFIYKDDPQMLANKIDEIISWDFSKYTELSKSIDKYIVENKKMANNSNEFNKWIRNILSESEN